MEVKIKESIWFDYVGIVKTESELGIRYYIGYIEEKKSVEENEKEILKYGTRASVSTIKTFFGLSPEQQTKPISNSVLKRREAMMWWNTLAERDKREYSKSSPNGLTGSVIEALYTKAFG